MNGDLNNDGNINVTDVILLVNYILNSETSQIIIYDINDDGNVNITDVVQLINIILN